MKFSCPLLLILLSVFSFSSVLAQEIKLNDIPYPLNLTNPSPDCRVTNHNSIVLKAPRHTDLFISPDGKFEINNSPRLMFRPDSSFVLTSKVKPDLKSKWDAGVLLVYNDAKHFAKFCFERDLDGRARVVSVVCTETADDCNSMIIDGNEVFYRIVGSAKGSTFEFHYSSDGKSWFPIRTFRLHKADNISIGFSAQSPTGKECNVEFSGIEFKQ